MVTVTVARQRRPASRTPGFKALRANTGALRIAVESSLVDRNVADQVRVPKSPKRPARFLEPDELVALAKASIWPASIWLLGTSGYCISEPLLVHPTGNITRADSYRSLVVLPAAKKAGIVGLTTHDLRHTAASMAIRSGADVKMVQEMLGHASAAMTLDL